jgi:malate dehydrogenase
MRPVPIYTGREPYKDMDAKIGVVGVGTVGESAAFNIARANICSDLVLIDLNEEETRGKALNISHATSFVSDTHCYYGTYEDVQDADVIITSAGKPRGPDMTRADLAEANAGIVSDIFSNFQGMDDTVFITTTNPMDVVNYCAAHTVDVPRERFIGFGNWLDSARFQYYVTEYCDVDGMDVDAYVIGQHGESMTPLFSHVTVNGETQTFPGEDREKLLEQVRNAAVDVIDKTGATQWGPAEGLLEMTRAVLQDENTVYPCSTVLHGEYGVEDVSIGVPCRIGANGVEEVVEWELTEAERDLFEQGAAHVKAMTDTVCGT